MFPLLQRRLCDIASEGVVSYELRYWNFFQSKDTTTEESLRRYIKSSGIATRTKSPTPYKIRVQVPIPTLPIPTVPNTNSNPNCNLNPNPSHNSNHNPNPLHYPFRNVGIAVVGIAAVGIAAASHNIRGHS